VKKQHGRDLTGEEMAEMLDEFANGSDRNEADAFAEHVTRRTHRTLQQKIMGLFVACVERWSEDEASKRYDLRNEATCKLARRITDATGDKYDRHLPLI